LFYLCYNSHYSVSIGGVMKMAIVLLTASALLAIGVGGEKNISPAIYKLPPYIVEISLRQNFSLKEIIEDFHMEIHHFLRLNSLIGVEVDKLLDSEIIRIIRDVRVEVKTNEDFCVSWYGEKYDGNTMANGEIFDMEDKHIVAHKWLPFGTKILLAFENKSLWLTVKDRGPFVAGRNFDVSKAAAEFLGIKDLGVANCELIDVRFPGA
jgi:rare lipoprotein A